MLSGNVYLQPVTPQDLDTEVFLNARREGYRFVDRLQQDWNAGTNRFDKSGEVLLGARVDDRYIGVGGLNFDPFTVDATVGRIRHVYVCPSYRRSGLGFALVKALIGHARKAFSVVRLRTENPDAARLYERLGFVPVQHPDATHVLRFG